MVLYQTLDSLSSSCCLPGHSFESVWSRTSYCCQEYQLILLCDTWTISACVFANCFSKYCLRIDTTLQQLSKFNHFMWFQQVGSFQLPNFIPRIQFCLCLIPFQVRIIPDKTRYFLYCCSFYFTIDPVAHSFVLKCNEF